jgi:hypothetical protein
MRHLMDFVPALDRPASIKVIADHVGVPEQQAFAYLQKWADKGLIQLL